MAAEEVALKASDAIQWVGLISGTLGAAIFSGVIALLLGAWIKPRFDTKLEQLRAEIKAGEKHTSALVAGVMHGEHARSEMLQRRRIESLEAIWRAVGLVVRYEMAVTFLQRLNLQEIEKVDSPEDIEKVKKLAAALLRLVPKIEENPQSSVFVERLHVGVRVWTLFAAYRGLVAFAMFVLKSLEEMGPHGLTLLKFDEMDRELILALSHQEKFIQEHPKSGMFFVADEIRHALLIEIEKELNGFDRSDKDLERSKYI